MRNGKKGKRMIAFLTSLMMGVSCAEAEGAFSNHIGIIGGADGPTTIFLNDFAAKKGQASVSFEANRTTGYEWTAAILGGDAVEIDQAASGYRSKPNPLKKKGVGGTHIFVLNALQPGESIIRFTYARSWEEMPNREVIMLATVDEDGKVYTQDVTASGVFEGETFAVDETEHAVSLKDVRHGEMTVVFPEGMVLPAKDEQIRIFTNGIMTRSLPPIVRVMAWERIPS